MSEPQPFQASVETEARTGPRRRDLLAWGGVGVVAAAAGAGLAWYQLKPGEMADDALSTLWTLSFEMPAGGQLSMAALRGRPLLINFWATWCPPCVEEFPLLDGFFRQNSSKRWQVVGLAIDQPSSVRTFLRKTPVSFPVGLAGLGGTELGKSLGNVSGGLPFTVVIAADGTVMQRRMGKVSEADLARWAGAA